LYSPNIIAVPTSPSDLLLLPPPQTLACGAVRAARGPTCPKMTRRLAQCGRRLHRRGSERGRLALGSRSPSLLRSLFRPAAKSLNGEVYLIHIPSEQPPPPLLAPSWRRRNQAVSKRRANPVFRDLRSVASRKSKTFRHPRADRTRLKELHSSRRCVFRGLLLAPRTRSDQSLPPPSCLFNQSRQPTRLLPWIATRRRHEDDLVQSRAVRGRSRL
jgi:hypothetical protein